VVVSPPPPSSLNGFDAESMSNLISQNSSPAAACERKPWSDPGHLLPRKACAMRLWTTDVPTRSEAVRRCDKNPDCVGLMATSPAHASKLNATSPAVLHARYNGCASMTYLESESSHVEMNPCKDSGTEPELRKLKEQKVRMASLSEPSSRQPAKRVHAQTTVVGDGAVVGETDTERSTCNLFALSRGGVAQFDLVQQRVESLLNEVAAITAEMLGCIEPPPPPPPRNCFNTACNTAGIFERTLYTGQCCFWGSSCDYCPGGHHHVWPSTCGTSRRCN
jgi:hypothetical protein